MSTSTGSISNELFKSYQQLSSGKRINSAADDAAGLAISEKMNAQARGWAQGTANAQDMQNLLRTAEGGLNNIADALQRMRELGIQALNDTNTDSDRAAMQLEVDQLKDFIVEASKGTQFNTMTLLDGSYADKNAATSPSGTGMTITIQDSTLEKLGIKDFDVTKVSELKEHGLSDVGNALDAVNAARASIGANMNRLEYTINANETSYLNQMQAMSRIADADMGKAVMQKNRAEVLQQYQIFSQKEQMQRTGMTLSLLR
jgi:flagellin